MITNKQFMMDQFWGNKQIQKFGISPLTIFLMQGKSSLAKESLIELFCLRPCLFPKDIARKFIKDKSPYVRASLARNVNRLPLDCVRVLLHDDNEEVRRLANSYCDPFQHNVLYMYYYLIKQLIRKTLSRLKIVKTIPDDNE